MPRRRSTPDATEQLFGDAVMADAPLAARMRPRTLDEFVGQPHLVGPDGALTRVVKPGHRPSLILWGPPGSGKTTLARLLADRAGGTWRQLTAVTSGVADIRALVAEAKALREAGGATIAFIDELHRFNKSQQDALLPHVEDGTISLIGATTENPYYEINSPLLSRMRVYRLDPLDTDALGEIIDRALADAERGLGRPRPAQRRGSRDAARPRQRRRARARSTSSRRRRRWSPTAPRSVPEGVAEAAQQRLLAYDRVGDQHYEAASAFIKSMRGNDPDAALYWCASHGRGGGGSDLHRAADRDRRQSRTSATPTRARSRSRWPPCRRSR